MKGWIPVFLRIAALAASLFVVATLAILATWMWRVGIAGSHRNP